jgi:2-aminoadipate transaminase
MYEPTFHEVDLEPDGIHMEEFKNAFVHHPIKLFYCIPNYQNPTGAVYSTYKRLEIALHIKKHETIIIEDDPYGEICFDGNQPDPIKSFNYDQVIHLGSFSKTVVPGFRIGWIAASAALIEKLTIMKQASDLHTNQLSQIILHEYLSTNSLQDHINKITDSYRMQKHKMVEMIKQYLPSEIEFIEPNGGMFLWLILPEFMNASEILRSAMEEGVIFVPGEHFYALRKAHNTIRLNYSNSTKEQIETGIQKLGKILKQKLKEELVHT